MAVWNAATPAGTDLIQQGDDIIRELKDALVVMFSHENSTFPGGTPLTAPIFIPGFLRGNTASRPTGDSLVTGRLYLNTTLLIIEWYDGANWQSAGTVLPSGTKMLFYQASPPTGWTAIAVNDKFIRVVTSAGTGGTTGGTIAASTTLAHTHTGPSHTHTATTSGPTGTQSVDTAGAPVVASDAHTHTLTTAASGTGATSSSLAGAMARADVCAGTKD